MENDLNLKDFDQDEQDVFNLLSDLVTNALPEEKKGQGEEKVQHVAEDTDDSESIITAILKSAPESINPEFVKKGIYFESVCFCDRAFKFESNPVFSEPPMNDYLEEVLTLGDNIFYCFDDEGLVLNRQRLIKYVCDLGKYSLLMPGLISTTLGVDAYKTSLKMYAELLKPGISWSEDASIKLPPIESDISMMLLEINDHEVSKDVISKNIVSILEEMSYCFAGGKFEGINGLALSYLAIALNHLVENILVTYYDISEALLKMTASICECIKTPFFEEPENA